MEQLRRLPGWPERLDSYVRSQHGSRFAWGSMDCVLFAAGAVEALTGSRPVLPVWRTEREALRQLRKRGGLALAVDGLGLFQRMANVRLARRGDLLMTQQPTGLALAVCLGHVWAAPSAAGLAISPIEDVAAAWKVG